MNLQKDKLILTKKEIRHFRLCLIKLLEFGRPPEWFVLQASEGHTVLLAELIYPNDVVAANNKNSWDIFDVLGRKPEKVVMIIVDFQNDKLINVIERGTDVPDPPFEGHEELYQLADRINFLGSPMTFPNWKVSIGLLSMFAFIIFILVKLIIGG